MENFFKRLFIILFVSNTLSSKIQSEELSSGGRSSGLPLFYWDARPQWGFSNFGDVLSEELIERIVGRKISIASSSFDENKKILAIGSIMNYAKEGDVIWGTGINGKSPAQAYRFTQLDVRAVRGPLTREFLRKR